MACQRKAALARYTGKMTSPIHPSRWRRAVALLAASVLLHYAAIGWVGEKLAEPADHAPQREPATIEAALLAAAPAPVQVGAPAAPVRPAPAVAAKARPRAARPARAAQPPSEAAPASASVIDAAQESPTAQAPAADTEAGAPEAQPPVQSGAPAEAPPVETQAPPAPAASAPGYRVSLPPPAELQLDVERVDAKGAHWSGRAVMDWSHSGDAYRMTMVATIRVIVTINLVELASEGAIGEHGIVPRILNEKRRSKAQTATHFDAQQGRISFSASSASFPMAPGTQDKATFLMQLAGIARADPAQLAADIEMMVGEDKDASLFKFVVQGQEEIDTPLGRLATWRITRPPRPGSYSSRLDLWLAPGHEWYPVQMRSTEANGAVTTQTIRKIVVKQAGT